MSTNTISRSSVLRFLGAAVAIIASGVLAFSFHKTSGPQDTYKEKEVFRNQDVVIRQIDEHTWEGNGHVMYNESIYLIEGSERAILLDAGTEIAGLDKIIAGITDKPVCLVATHVHPDHTGSAVNDFAEIWINAADMVNVPQFMPDYKGKINYLYDGQVFDLGGREIEVIFAPGHTPGSTLFFDKDKKYGFSGDAFGSGNLLLTTNFSTLLATAARTEAYIQKHGITKMYPGHYGGQNHETPERISNLKHMSEEMLSGKRQGTKSKYPSLGLDYEVSDFGVTVHYNGESGVK